VVRALANNPDVLLMDEPFASVDAQTRMTLQEELTKIWQERRPTILFITHDVAESVFLADRVVVLSKGRVLEDMPIQLQRPRVWENLIEDDTFKALSSQVLNKVRSALAFNLAIKPRKACACRFVFVCDLANLFGGFSIRQS
jgi:NitT/TauT family transport system ATP-binding protein